MSSSSSSNVQDDAWLMKIELKREEPVGAAKEDKGKEATGDQALVVEQAMPIEEEEEDILKPHYDHLTSLRLKPSGSLKRFMCKQNTSLVKIYSCKRTSPSSGVSSVDWRIF